MLTFANISLIQYSDKGTDSVHHTLRGDIGVRPPSLGRDFMKDVIVCMVIVYSENILLFACSIV